MSSILKALKKLENEGSQRAEDPATPKKLDTKKAINKRVKGTWLFYKFFSILFVVIVLLIGGGLILSQKSFLMKKFFPGTAPPEPLKEEIKGASLPVQKKVTKATMPKKLNTATAKSANLAVKAAPGLSSSTKKVSTSKAVEQSEPSVIKGGKPLKIKGSIPKKQIDESRFKLEAIVWSNNPKSRFAVINGRIVRAGGSIEEMSVISIDRDYVALQTDDIDWELRFTIE